MKKEVKKILEEIQSQGIAQEVYDALSKDGIRAIRTSNGFPLYYHNDEVVGVYFHGYVILKYFSEPTVWNGAEKHYETIKIGNETSQRFPDCLIGYLKNEGSALVEALFEIGVKEGRTIVWLDEYLGPGVMANYVYLGSGNVYWEGKSNDHSACPVIRVK